MKKVKHVSIKIRGLPEIHNITVTSSHVSGSQKPAILQKKEAKEVLAVLSNNATFKPWSLHQYS